jgi:hypothetical protein
MIARYVLHIEAHRGYRPRLSLRRAPQPGDRVTDGGIPGTLVRCPQCGEGMLHAPDSGWLSPLRPPAEPAPPGDRA